MRFGWLRDAGKHFSNYEVSDLTRGVMNTCLNRVGRIPLVTESLIHLAEDTNRDVCEVQIVPIDRVLDRRPDSVPTAEYCLKMLEHVILRRITRSFVEGKILLPALSARSLWVDAIHKGK